MHKYTWKVPWAKGLPLQFNFKRRPHPFFRVRFFTLHILYKGFSNPLWFLDTAKFIMKTVQLYTDGACSGNPGLGGYCSILIYNGIEKVISGSENSTTNNRMEILAVIKGLEALKEKCHVEVYSDSQYVVDAFNQGWIISWQENGWKTASKKEVKNPVNAKQNRFLGCCVCNKSPAALQVSQVIFFFYV